MTVAPDRGLALFDTHAHLISDDAVRYPPSRLRGRSDAGRITAHFTAEWLLGQMEAQGVARACVVQRAHIYGYDNRYVIDSARRYPDRLMSVVVLDAQEEGTPAALRDMVQHQDVRGVRFAASDVERYDTAWLNSPEAMACWETAAALSLPVAIIFYRRHLSYALPALAMIAGLFPELPIIVDHVGTPHTASGNEVAWFAGRGIPLDLPVPPDHGLDGPLMDLMAHRNVRLKITTIVFDRLADGGTDPAVFVRALVDRFGADRLIWGSDIGQSPGSYAEKVEMIRRASALLTAQERQQLSFDTAADLYAPERGLR